MLGYHFVCLVALRIEPGPHACKASTFLFSYSPSPIYGYVVLCQSRVTVFCLSYVSNAVVRRRDRGTWWKKGYLGLQFQSVNGNMAAGNHGTEAEAESSHFETKTSRQGES